MSHHFEPRIIQQIDKPEVGAVPRVVGAIFLGLVLYLYIIVALAAIEPHYLETVNRVSMLGSFHYSLFGSKAYDQVALLGLTLLFLLSHFRSNQFTACAAVAFVAVISFQQIFRSADVLLYTSLASPPASILAVMFHRSRSQVRNNRKIPLTRTVALNLVAASFLSISIAVEIASLTERTIVPVSVPSSEDTTNVSSLESGIFHSLAILSPLMLVLVAFSFLYRNYFMLAARRILRQQKHQERNSEIIDVEHGTMTVQEGPIPLANISRIEKSAERHSWADWVLLAIAVTVSFAIALYPHLPSVNPSGSGVSTDERAYLAWMSAMQDRILSGPQAVIGYAFSTSGGDRPLSLLMLYAIGNVEGNFSSVVRYAPVVLSPAVVLASFVLARYGLSFGSWRTTRRRASIIAIFAALSPQVVVGVYAGFLANWIALVPALLSILALAKAWDSKDHSTMKKYVTAFFGLLILTMLCHVYMWGHLVIVASIFLALSIWSARHVMPDYRIKTLVLAAAIVASIVVDLAKSETFRVPSGLSSDTTVAGYSFDLANFDSRWATLSYTLWEYVGGYILAPVLIALTLFWVFKMRMSSNSVERVVLSMLFVLAIPILFGNMTVQARLMYDTPFFIPAALALFTTGRARLTSLLSVTLVILIFANYAVGAMGNLNLVVPDNAILVNPFLVP